MIALISSMSFLKLSQNYDIIKVFRFLRILRPLRLVNRFPFMRIAIESIFNSVPQYANLLLILLLVNFLFSILGTSFFKGTFNTCHMDNVRKENIKQIKTKWECYDFGGEWTKPNANFDNVVNAMGTLFQAMTTEGWVHTMWSGVDSTSVNNMPKSGNNPGYAIFFVVFMVLSAIIILNLFVGVVIDSNSQEKEKLLNNN